MERCKQERCSIETGAWGACMCLVPSLLAEVCARWTQASSPYQGTWFIICQLCRPDNQEQIVFRDCHGLPWGFSRQPVPIPVKTHTCTKCMGFYTYGSRVGYNPRVSKPIQIKAWVHIKSDSNIEKNYQGLLNPNPYPYPYAPAASTRTGLQTCDIP